MKEGHPHPPPEDLEVEVKLDLSRLIEDRIVEGLNVVYVSLHDVGENARPGGPEGVIKHREPVRKVNLPGVTVVKREPHLAED
jgi:hypothetical protein